MLEYTQAGDGARGVLAVARQHRHPEPLRAQFNRTGDRLYVIHAAYPYLFVIDPSTFSTVQQQFIGSGVAAIKVDTWNDLLYLVKKNDTMITLFNPITFAPVGYIPTRGIVEYMTIDNATNSLYAAVPERNSLVIFNLVNRKPVAEIDVNRRPSWISLPGER
jgi:DNA-binding beta-propeller fold protein YncE